MRAIRTRNLWLFAAVPVVFFFQNCANPRVDFAEQKLGSLGVCDGVSCDLTPLTFKPAVATVLMAMGDEADDQLVVDGASSQLVAETVVRYSSPVQNPRIALVIDQQAVGEDPEDTVYVRDVLLKRYNVTVINEPSAGLTLEDLRDYDLVWHNNPGRPMGSRRTRDTYLAFRGGVILQGDDLSWGQDSAGRFDMSTLTGLRHVDNGAQVTCGGVTYSHDNNGGESYRVNLDVTKIPGASGSSIDFRYGNDIDDSTPLRPDLQILATARGGPASCTATRPAIVRYER